MSDNNTDKAKKLYKDLQDKGKTAKQAAKIIRDNIKPPEDSK